MSRQYHSTPAKDNPSRSVQENIGAKGLQLPAVNPLQMTTDHEAGTVPVIQRQKGLEKDTLVFAVDYGTYWKGVIKEVHKDSYLVEIPSLGRVVKVPEKWVTTDETYAEMLAVEINLHQKSHIFGLDAKDEPALEIAIKAGYRVFDMAETYRVNLKVLMELIDKHGIPRSAITIIYKIGHHKGSEDVMQAAMEGIAIAGGYIDILMLHESPDNTRLLKQNLQIVQELVQAGKVKRGGISNITSFALQDLDDVNTALKDITVFQDLFNLKNYKGIEETGASPEELLKAANPGTEIIKMAYSILENRHELAPDPAFLEKYSLTKEQAISIWARKKGYIPVNSSSREDVTGQNLEVTTPKYDAVWDLDAREIENALTGNVKTIQTGQDTAFSKLAGMGLGDLYNAAKSGALTNDLGLVLHQLSIALAPLKSYVFPKLPLLWNNTSQENHYKERFVFLSDINEDKLNGFACNNKLMCEAIVRTLADYVEK